MKTILNTKLILFFFFIILISCSIINRNIEYRTIYIWKDENFKNSYPYHHQNSIENLDLKLRLNKNFYYPGEIIDATLILLNKSYSDTIFIFKPYFSNRTITLQNEYGEKLYKKQGAVPICGQIRIYDSQRREFIKLTMPQNLLNPRDSICINGEHLFDFYGKMFNEVANKAFHFPYELPLGKYNTYFTISHIELDEKKNPISRQIVSNKFEFQIIPVDKEINLEYLDYIIFTNSLLKSKVEKTGLILNYLEKYPKGIYKRNILKYYKRISG